MIRRLIRMGALGVVLALVLVVVPDSGVARTDAYLVSVQGAKGVDRPKDVLWVLMLGSDARLGKGEDVLRSRADAIHLVGLNLKTGDSVAFGVPRDSWVSIPGRGSQRVNAALNYGGPSLMAKTVSAMFDLPIDYVFVTSFEGFSRMVKSIGGITVYSPRAFSDPKMPGRFVKGDNRVNGMDAVRFARMRYRLPGGDFDRSANQNELIRGIMNELVARQAEVGFLGAGMMSFLRNMETDLGPVELYRLAHAAKVVDPKRMTACVLPGSLAMISGQSVVRPNLTKAKQWAKETRADAQLSRC